MSDLTIFEGPVKAPTSSITSLQEPAPAQSGDQGEA